ncbi:MAG TPA: OmpA family protein [Polyangia bacterium]|nr:OmpA family protein [Polyangia bacterium]
MISSYQRSDLQYGGNVQGAIFGGLAITESLTAELAVRNWWFPSNLGYGRGTLIGPGARYWFLDGARGAAFANADLGVGINGDTARFMFDLGAGYVFHVSGPIDLGPVLRYGEVVAGGGDTPSDARFWSLGITVGFRADRWSRETTTPSPAPAVSTPAPPPRARAVAAAPVRPADRDQDGVDDLHDACPDVAAGPTPDPERAGCPDGDQDKDGVADHADQCRAEAKGLHPDPARAGCPLPDRDRDSVPDGEDHCPDKPGAPNPDPKLNGCPGLVKVAAGKIEINRPVFFATGEDRILPKSFPVLLAVANALKLTPEIHTVEIQGHTDAQGGGEKNQDLSQRRAGSVRSWLVQHGVDTLRLRARGFGDSHPISTNKTAQGRSTNRRVEFLIVDPAPDSIS